MKYPFLVAAVTASFGLALACSTTTLVQPGEDGGGPPAGDPTVDAGTPDPAMRWLSRGTSARLIRLSKRLSNTAWITLPWYMRILRSSRN